jgi:hypothetical protein
LVPLTRLVTLKTVAATGLAVCGTTIFVTFPLPSRLVKLAFARKKSPIIVDVEVDCLEVVETWGTGGWVVKLAGKRLDLVVVKVLGCVGAEKLNNLVRLTSADVLRNTGIEPWEIMG